MSDSEHRHPDEDVEPEGEPDTSAETTYQPPPQPEPEGGATHDPVPDAPSDSEGGDAA